VLQLFGYLDGGGQEVDARAKRPDDAPFYR
jgi:hypothetical protein